MSYIKNTSFFLCFSITNLFAADYAIPEGEVEKFLGIAAHGQCYQRTAYAYDKTITICLRHLVTPAEVDKKDPFKGYNLKEFTDNLLKRMLHKSMLRSRFYHPDAESLTQEDFDAATETFCGGESVKKKKLACIMLIAEDQTVRLQSFNNLFPMQEFPPINPDTRSQLPETFFATFSLSPETPVIELGFTGSNLTPGAIAQQLFASAKDKDPELICVAFNPQQWANATDFRPFIKPERYPILCDEFRKGFKIGAFSALGFALAVTYYNKSKPQHEHNEHAPLLTPFAAVWTDFLALLFASEDIKPYERFFTGSTEVSTDWSRNPALSEQIFNSAVACRATLADRRDFRALYEKLREKLDKDEPCETEELACDKLLSFWQDRSTLFYDSLANWRYSGPCSYIPVHKTRRIHNQLYGEAIEGIKKARVYQGFAAGTAIALPIAFLQMLFLCASSI